MRAALCGLAGRDSRRALSPVTRTLGEGCFWLWCALAMGCVIAAGLVGRIGRGLIWAGEFCERQAATALQRDIYPG